MEQKEVIFDGDKLSIRHGDVVYSRTPSSWVQSITDNEQLRHKLAEQKAEIEQLRQAVVFLINKYSWGGNMYHAGYLELEDYEKIRAILRDMPKAEKPFRECQEDCPLPADKCKKCDEKPVEPRGYSCHVPKDWRDNAVERPYDDVAMEGIATDVPRFSIEEILKVVNSINFCRSTQDKLSLKCSCLFCRMYREIVCNAIMKGEKK